MVNIIIGGGITGLFTAVKISDAMIIDEKENLRNSNASLWSIIPPLCGKYFNECLKGEDDYVKIANEYGIYFRKTFLLRKSEKPLGGGKMMDKKEIKEIEPSIDLEYAEYFDNSLFIDGDELLQKIGKEFPFLHAKVTKIDVKDNYVESIETSAGVLKGENYIITASYLLSDLIGNYVKLTPFKGHLIIAEPYKKLNGIVVIGDRIAVQGKKMYLNGDSKQDSSMDIDFEEVKKTISTFSELINKSNLEIRVGFRSVSENNEPVIIKPFKNLMIVGGYRFGYAIAPYLAEKVKEMLKG
ncbi:MAG: FAD-dependent oxidoreductase [Acidianus sp.]